MDIPKRGQPIKRHTKLKALSRVNHDILVFCLNINLGIRANCSLDRINKYINAYTETSLLSNLNFKKNYLYPLISNEEIAVNASINYYYELVKQGLVMQKTLEEIILFEKTVYTQIRIEERILLNALQDYGEEASIVKLKEQFVKLPLGCMRWDDAFWKTANPR